MNFEDAIRELNAKLRKKNPQEFSSSWILKYIPRVYRFVRLNVRTEIGKVDWDRVTVALDYKFQKRWKRYMGKSLRPYESRVEINRVLSKNRNKLYVFIACQNREDRDLRESMTVALARAAQRGNVLAKRELTTLLRYTVDKWIERYWFFRRWRGYESELQARIEGCIKRYRYSGSFTSYLFKTIGYSARALRSTYLLDDYTPGTELRSIDMIGMDPESGEIKNYFHRSQHWEADR